MKYSCKISNNNRPPITYIYNIQFMQHYTVQYSRVYKYTRQLPVFAFPLLRSPWLVFSSSYSHHVASSPRGRIEYACLEHLYSIINRVDIGQWGWFFMNLKENEKFDIKT